MSDQTFVATLGELASFETMTSMSGLEFMTRVRDGTLPAPPISRTLNYRVDTVEDGRVVFRGTPGFDHTNPLRTVHGGWYGTLLDSCMACAVMTKLPRGKYYTTLEHKVNIIKGIPLDREVLAEGTVNHAGRSTGVATGEIRDADTNRLYATGSTTCIIMDAN